MATRLSEKYPKPGDRFHHFQILSVLGGGMWGKVFKALTPHRPGEIALKLIPIEVTGRCGFGKDVVTALPNLVDLEHENLVNVFSVRIIEPFIGIEMEFVEGPDLGKIIPPDEGIELARALRIFRGITKGLLVAHAAKILHRDLKPENILLGGDGVPKISDFDLVRLTSTAASGGNYPLAGTAPYISPEQCTGGQADRRSDIYALGVIFYSVTTGRIPFDSESPLLIFWKAVHKAPVSPKILRPELPDGLATLIMDMLSKDPSDRPQEADHVLQRLALLGSGDV